MEMDTTEELIDRGRHGLQIRINLWTCEPVNQLKFANMVTLFLYSEMCVLKIWITNKTVSSDLLLDSFNLYRSTRKKVGEAGHHCGVMKTVNIAAIQNS